MASATGVPARPPTEARERDPLLGPGRDASDTNAQTVSGNLFSGECARCTPLDDDKLLSGRDATRC